MSSINIVDLRLLIDVLKELFSILPNALIYVLAYS